MLTKKINMTCSTPAPSCRGHSVAAVEMKEAAAARGSESKSKRVRWGRGELLAALHLVLGIELPTLFLIPVSAAFGPFRNGADGLIFCDHTFAIKKTTNGEGAAISTCSDDDGGAVDTKLWPVPDKETCEYAAKVCTAESKLGNQDSFTASLSFDTHWTRPADDAISYSHCYAFHAATPTDDTEVERSGIRWGGGGSGQGESGTITAHVERIICLRSVPSRDGRVSLLPPYKEADAAVGLGTLSAKTGIRNDDAFPNLYDSTNSGAYIPMSTTARFGDLYFKDVLSVSSFGSGESHRAAANDKITDYEDEDNEDVPPSGDDFGAGIMAQCHPGFHVPADECRPDIFSDPTSALGTQLPTAYARPDGETYKYTNCYFSSAAANRNKFVALLYNEAQESNILPTSAGTATKWKLGAQDLPPNPDCESDMTVHDAAGSGAAYLHFSTCPLVTDPNAIVAAKDNQWVINNVAPVSLVEPSKYLPLCRTSRAAGPAFEILHAEATCSAGFHVAGTSCKGVGLQDDLLVQSDKGDTNGNPKYAKQFTNLVYPGLADIGSSAASFSLLVSVGGEATSLGDLTARPLGAAIFVEPLVSGANAAPPLATHSASYGLRLANIPGGAASGATAADALTPETPTAWQNGHVSAADIAVATASTATAGQAQGEAIKVSGYGCVSNLQTTTTQTTTTSGDFDFYPTDSFVFAYNRAKATARTPLYHDGYTSNSRLPDAFNVCLRAQVCESGAYEILPPGRPCALGFALEVDPPTGGAAAVIVSDVLTSCGTALYDEVSGRMSVLEGVEMPTDSELATAGLPFQLRVDARTNKIIFRRPISSSGEKDYLPVVPLYQHAICHRVQACQGTTTAGLPLEVFPPGSDCLHGFHLHSPVLNGAQPPADTVAVLERQISGSCFGYKPIRFTPPSSASPAATTKPLLFGIYFAADTPAPASITTAANLPAVTLNPGNSYLNFDQNNGKHARVCYARQAQTVTQAEFHRAAGLKGCETYAHHMLDPRLCGQAAGLAAGGSARVTYSDVLPFGCSYLPAYAGDTTVATPPAEADVVVNLGGVGYQKNYVMPRTLSHRAERIQVCRAAAAVSMVAPVTQQRCHYLTAEVASFRARFPQGSYDSVRLQLVKYDHVRTGFANGRNVWAVSTFDKEFFSSSRFRSDAACLQLHGFLGKVGKLNLGDEEFSARILNARNNEGQMGEGLISSHMPRGVRGGVVEIFTDPTCSKSGHARLDADETKAENENGNPNAEDLGTPAGAEGDTFSLRAPPEIFDTACLDDSIWSNCDTTNICYQKVHEWRTSSDYSSCKAKFPHPTARGAGTSEFPSYLTQQPDVLTRLFAKYERCLLLGKYACSGVSNSENCMCDAGYVGEMGATSFSCKACPAGTYQPMRGMFRTATDAGNEATVSKSCIPCPPGSYGPREGQAACMQCPNNQPLTAHSVSTSTTTTTTDDDSRRRRRTEEDDAAAEGEDAGTPELIGAVNAASCIAVPSTAVDGSTSTTEATVLDNSAVAMVVLLVVIFNSVLLVITAYTVFTSAGPPGGSFPPMVGPPAAGMMGGGMKGGMMGGGKGMMMGMKGGGKMMPPMGGKKAMMMSKKYSQ
ncbi:unnamed protein product [Amoebophrya sp. A120]|nr:unnamed protein product [Amoebophrya sp. A120]|eukprot:GSA120T00013410001.1